MHRAKASSQAVDDSFESLARFRLDRYAEALNGAAWLYHFSQQGRNLKIVSNGWIQLT